MWSGGGSLSESPGERWGSRTASGETSRKGLLGEDFPPLGVAENYWSDIFLFLQLFFVYRRLVLRRYENCQLVTLTLPYCLCRHNFGVSVDYSAGTFVVGSFLCCVSWECRHA